MFWLGLLLLAGLAGALTVRRVQLLPHRRQKLLPGATDSLRSFAEDTGWKLYEGTDKQIKGEAWKLFALAGPPSLEVLYALKAMTPVQLVKTPEAYGHEEWEPVAVLRRDTADGPQTVLGATAAGGTRVVIVCAATQATVDHFGLDIVGWDSRVYASGEAPESVDFNDVLAGLSAPLRVRFAEGTLLLRVPGTLSPAFITTLIERLDMIRDALPRRPDLIGPRR